MLGSKSNKDSQQFDTFACLRCETTVTFGPPPKGSKPERRRLGRRAILLHKPTCRRRNFVEGGCLPTISRAC